MFHSNPFIVIFLAVFLVSVLRLDLLAQETGRFSLARSDLGGPEYSLLDEGMVIQLAASDIPFPNSGDVILLAREDFDGDGVPDDPPIKGRKWTEGEKRIVLGLLVSAFFLLAIFICMDNLIEQDGIHVY